MSDQFIDHKYRRGLLETPHPYRMGKHRETEMRQRLGWTEQTFACPVCDNVYEPEERVDSVFCHGDGFVEARDEPRDDREWNDVWPDKVKP